MAEMQMYDPFDELKRIEERIASIFGGQFPVTGTNMNTPSVDIQQHGNEIVVTADMPGVDKNDMQINVRDDRILEISAQKKIEKSRRKRQASYVGSAGTWDTIVPSCCRRSSISPRRRHLTTTAYSP